LSFYLNEEKITSLFLIVLFIKIRHRLLPFCQKFNKGRKFKEFKTKRSSFTSALGTFGGILTIFSEIIKLYVSVQCSEISLCNFFKKKFIQRGLKIGTFTGYSALWMGLALQKTGGELITIEIDKGYGQVAQQNFQKAGLEDVIDSRINDAFCA